MKSTIITEDGSVECPKCGAQNVFTERRTTKAKALGVCMGAVGVLVMPKRLKCGGCGEFLKRSGRSAKVAA